MGYGGKRAQDVLTNVRDVINAKSSTQELNKHYRLKHKPLMCGICNKLFDLPGTLKKHMYGHLDKLFKMQQMQ